MFNFLLIVKGSMETVEKALADQGLDADRATDHGGRVTCFVKGELPTVDILNRWFASDKGESPSFKGGSLLYFKKVPF